MFFALKGLTTWKRARGPAVPLVLVGKRSTNYTVERGAGFGRLVPGGPSGGRKFSDSIDRKIG